MRVLATSLAVLLGSSFALAPAQTRTTPTQKGWSQAHIQKKLAYQKAKKKLAPGVRRANPTGGILALVGGSDSCATPDPISGQGTFPYDQTAATTGVEGQNEGLCFFFGTSGIDNDVWFEWTADATGDATVDTCGSPNDTKIAAYPGGGCPTDGTSLACNDDFCGLQSSITFPVTAGTSYMLQIGTFPGSSGSSGNVNIAISLPPSGSDDCATADPIAGQGSFPFDQTSATTGLEGQNEGLCYFFGNSAIDNDVWFEWTADATGNATVDTCGCTHDTKIAAYPGGGCPADGSALACNDDSCGLQSSITFPVTAGASYMLQIGTFPGASGGSCNLNIQIVTPGDDCVGPVSIAGQGTFAFDNSGATTGLEGQNEALCYFFGNSGIDNDVWFDWTADLTGTATVDTCGSSLDSKIAAYPGGGCPADGTSLACNDDSCSLQSSITFPVIAGTSYMLQVGTFPGSPGGSGALNISIVGGGTPTGSDDCATADPIAGQGTFLYDQTAATTGVEGQNEGLCYFFGTSGVDNDVWFEWTADATGDATVDTCGSSNDTKIAAYPGGGCPTDGTSLACNDDSCGFQSSITFPVTAGTSYMLQIGTFPGSSGGSGNVNIAISLPPSGSDDCATADPIAGQGTFPYDQTAATTGVEGQNEGLCYFFGTSGIDNDVWFEWTADATGNATVDTCGSSNDTKIAAYPGGGCPTDGSALACNDDACGLQSSITFPVTAGTSYMLQIGTFPGASGGSGNVNISITGALAEDNCTTPAVIAGQGNFAFDNSAATTGLEGQNEGLCYFFGNSGIDNDVWYEWTADADGIATLATCNNTSVDTKIAVYPGSGCPLDGTALACNDDACAFQSEVQFDVTAGSTYMLQIGTFPGSSGGAGSFDISISGVIPFCFGDGSALFCPCGDNGAPGEGCANSTGNGMFMVAGGTTSVAAGDLRLQAQNGPPGQPGLFFQGTSDLSPGVVFGDGYRCAGGTTVRIEVRIIDSQGKARTSASVNIAAKGGVSAGDTRYYQFWYRDPADPCIATFNLSSGLIVIWTP